MDLGIKFHRKGVAQMVRIIGLSEETVNDIIEFVNSSENCGIFDYSVELCENVKLSYSFGDLTLSDSTSSVMIKSFDYNEVTIC